jgi:mannan endo-1,4-beta-mannosidase
MRGWERETVRDGERPWPVTWTWAFSDSDGGGSALQYSPGRYNENTFQVIILFISLVPMTRILEMFLLFICVVSFLVSWRVAGLFFHLLLFVQGLDFVLSEARKHEIKMILSLVNNYDSFGGRKQYVQWARERGQTIDRWLGEWWLRAWLREVRGLGFWIIE